MRSCPWHVAHAENSLSAACRQRNFEESSSSRERGLQRCVSIKNQYGVIVVKSVIHIQQCCGCKANCNSCGCKAKKEMVKKTKVTVFNRKIPLCEQEDEDRNKPAGLSRKELVLVFVISDLKLSIVFCFWFCLFAYFMYLVITIIIALPLPLLSSLLQFPKLKGVGS